MKDQQSSSSSSRTLNFQISQREKRASVRQIRDKGEPKGSPDRPPVSHAPLNRFPFLPILLLIVVERRARTHKREMWRTLLRPTGSRLELRALRSLLVYPILCAPLFPASFS